MRNKDQMKLSIVNCTIMVSILVLHIILGTVFATPPPDIEGQTNYGTEWTITGPEYRGNQTIIVTCHPFGTEAPKNFRN